MKEQTLTAELKKYITTLTEKETLAMQQNLLDELNKGLLGDEYNAEFDFLSHCIRLHRKLSTIAVKEHNRVCGNSNPNSKFYTIDGRERKSGYIAFNGNSYYFGATKKKAIECAIFAQTITYEI